MNRLGTSLLLALLFVLCWDRAYGKDPNWSAWREGGLLFGGSVDAFDAMNSDRPYRHKLTREAILEELRKSRGVQYPVAVVDGFLELLAENPELWIRTQTPAPDYT